MDLLITGKNQFRDLADVPYAVLTIHYRDGGSADVPILYRRQVWEHWQPTDHAGKARVAYLGAGSSDASVFLSAPSVFAVELANPEPDREVASLSLAAVDRAWSWPVLLAATLVPTPDMNMPVLRSR